MSAHAPLHSALYQMQVLCECVMTWFKKAYQEGWKVIVGGFEGGGRTDRKQWHWFCKDGQGWICFQTNRLPELTPHVAQAVVLPEGR